VSQGQRAEAVAWDGIDPGFQGAEARGRAKSVTQPGILPRALPLPDVTLRDARERAMAAADGIGRALTAVNSGAHVHGQRPSVHAARERVHERAAGWNAGLAKALVYGWGYLVWLPAHALLLTLDLLIEYPLILFTVAGLAWLGKTFLL
jgi:hypothetical protein